MLTDRLLEIIEAQTDPRNRFKRLEEATKIGKDSWAAVWHRKQRPTAEMIEAIAKLWPDYAFWLASGITEPDRGHIAPETADDSYPIVKGVPQEWATAERTYMVKLLEETPKDMVERKERAAAIQKEVAEVRAGHVMPAVQLCYERIMKILNQQSRDDLFLLEYDSELRKIRTKRWKAEEKLQRAIHIERVHLNDSAQIEKVLDKLRLDKLLTKLKFWKRKED